MEREFVTSNFPNGEAVKHLVVHEYWRETATQALLKLQTPHRLKVKDGVTTMELLNARP